MNQAQRIVVVIALGIGMLVAAVAANFVFYEPYGGWFDLAPNIGATFSPSQTDNYFVVMSDRMVLEQAGVWLLALATWVGASLLLLRTRPSTEAPE